MKTTKGSKAASPFRIVVGLDFKDAGGFAFGQAARVAARIPGCQVHLLHVFEEEPTEARRRELVEQLRSYVSDDGTAGSALRNVSVGIHLRTGKPVQELVQLATELDAGLIVVGTHKGPQLKSLFVGTVAEHLIAVSPCPVLVAGPRPSLEESSAVVIEPPCPACVGTRAASHGATWWCETHGHPAKQAHAFSYMRELPLATHDSEVIPTGVQF